MLNSINNKYFRKRLSISLAIVYFCLSTYLFLRGLFWQSSDGGEWLLMFYIYYPLSYVVEFCGRILRLLTTNELWNGPSDGPFSLQVFYDGLSCVCLGTLWYYFIGYYIGKFVDWIKRGRN